MDKPTDRLTPMRHTDTNMEPWAGISSTQHCYTHKNPFTIPHLVFDFNSSCCSLVSQLVSWCFEPSQPRRITSGLNTNFTLSPSHSFHKSSYPKSCFFQPIYIRRALNTGTCIQQGGLFYSAGLHRSQCQPQPTQEKIGRGFGKNAAMKESISRVYTKGDMFVSAAEIIIHRVVHQGLTTKYFTSNPIAIHVEQPPWKLRYYFVVAFVY